MNRLHVVGRKNQGKTRLVIELVEWFAARGKRVATIKHTHHRHELDTPGKDSYLHRQAGAVATGVLSRSLSAVFIRHDEQTRREQLYQRLVERLGPCDLILVEGDLEAAATKIEVWRSAIGSPPLALQHGSIQLVVSDDRIEEPLPVPQLPRSDLGPLAAWIERQVLGGPADAG